MDLNVFMFEDILIIMKGQRGAVISCEHRDGSHSAFVFLFFVFCFFLPLLTDFHTLGSERHLQSHSSRDLSVRSRYLQGWFPMTYFILGCRWPATFSLCLYTVCCVLENPGIYLFIQGHQPYWIRALAL